MSWLVLKKTLPIHEKHGAKEGKEFEVIFEEKGAIWFKGDAGEPVKAFTREVRMILEPTKKEVKNGN